MKIYLASSWKNEETVFQLAEYLRHFNHEVDAFVDTSGGRFVFHFSEIGNPDELDAVSFLRDERSQRAFVEDKKWLGWAECCILVLPAGRSAHLEAGYAKGQDKHLIIFAPDGFLKGEFDVMYGFADFMTNSCLELSWHLKTLQGKATTPLIGETHVTEVTK